MEKILDKVFPTAATRSIKLHQKYEWAKTEEAFIRERYEERKNKKVNKFVYKANKKLASAAYFICDKNEYADSIFKEKLQKYDVKAYLSHRAANHKAAKSIFKSIKAGEDWSYALSVLRKENEEINRKRAIYLEKLYLNRNDFIAKQRTNVDYEAAKVILAELKSEEKNFNPFTGFQKINSKLDNLSPAEIRKIQSRHKELILQNERDKQNTYNSILEQLEDERSNLVCAIDAKHSAEIERKGAKLRAKMDSISKDIAELKSKHPAKFELGDDVLLSVKGLKMYFGGLKAVDDLTFEVKKGEIFGLIGPNGAGKTTVFNCITRFYDATAGEMYFENKYGEVVDLRRYKVHDIILQGISRTFQNIELVKEVSVIENLLVAATRSYSTGVLAHALALPRLKKEEIQLRRKAMNILKIMGIESYANWLAFGLPYGILKKVEIARALMADAKLIIMDEPAAGLNDSETAELTKTIRRIRDEFGVTILLVEHDMSLVMNVCDTVCAISFGQMLAIGNTEEIQANKAVQEAYLGVKEDD